MASAFFPYSFDQRYSLLWMPFGVRRESDGVTVTDDVFRATFGFFTLETPRRNVKGGHITERYRWYTAIGARLSFADDGLTFGTNPDRGVCVHFHERTRAVVGWRRHSALTVTVADCEGLLAAIGEA
jgi:hypothetical protein